MQVLADDDEVGSSKVTALLAQDDTLDCDSDGLEALEDAADEEESDDEGLNLEVDRAALLYPPKVVTDLLEELKQDGMMSFIENRIIGKSEEDIKVLFIAFGVLLPKELRSGSMSPELLVSVLKTILTRHLRQRKKLEQYNTVDDAVELIGRSRKIIVLSGSGISTSVGIPDFRSKDGIYAQLQREGKYNLIDPQEMFDKEYFLHDPSCFFSFAKRIFPSNFVPSPAHRFVKLLEDRGSLLRNYTQNIDTLEEAAGIDKVLYCHGSFSQAQCTTPGCSYKVNGSVIKPDIFAQRIPYCPCCAEAESTKGAALKRANGAKKWKANKREDEDSEEESDTLRGLGVVKPCITFFGEALSDEFDKSLLADRGQVDLLIIIGTSLQVAPVSELVGHIPHRTPVILINKTPVVHIGIDIQLLGDADGIVEYLCKKLQWVLPSPEPNTSVVGGNSVAEEVTLSNEVPEKYVEEEPRRIGESHFWLFLGAEAEPLIKMMEEGQDSDDSSRSEIEDREEREPHLEGLGESVHDEKQIRTSSKRKSSADLKDSTKEPSKAQRHM